MGRAKREQVMPGMVWTCLGVSSWAEWKVLMFSKAVSMACLVEVGRAIRLGGNGALRMGDLRVAFSNLAVYSRRAVSPRVFTASMIDCTTGIICAVFWIGRERRAVRSEDDKDFAWYTRILILVSSSVGGNVTTTTGAGPSFSAFSIAFVSEGVSFVTFSSGVVHFGFASPLRRLIFLARLSSWASTSARETPLATHFVMAKNIRSATSQAISFGSVASQTSSASSMILERRREGSENNLAT